MRRKYSKWLCLVLIFSSASGNAQRPETRSVAAYVEEISRLYEDLDYERALSELTKAKRIASTPEENALLLLYEGILLSELGREEESVAAFNVALVMQPESLLPMTVSPKIQRRFEILKEQHATRVVDSEDPVLKPTEQIEASSGADSPAMGSQPDVSDHKSTGMRVLIPAIAGGVTLASGGVLWRLAKNEQTRLRGNSPELATIEDVRRSASRGRTYQTVGFGLMGAGLVGLGVASGLYMLGGPDTPVSLSVGPNGASASLQGRWP